MSDDTPLSADDERLLAGLLDIVIPPRPEARLPGAGGLDLTAHVLRTIARTPMLRSVLGYGLSALADRARQRNPAGWAALAAEERTAIVREFAAGDQFFMPAFLFVAYSGYYTDPRVLQALGLEARPPHPQGYEMGPDDLSLLEAVRRRGKLYREC